MTNQDYAIIHAGSLMAGESNTQKTIEEIFALFKTHKPESFTMVKKYRNNNHWFFWGNFIDLSNVFHVEIYSPKLAEKARRLIKKSLTMDEVK